MFFLHVCLYISLASVAYGASRSLFVPENGRYEYSIHDIVKKMNSAGMNYVQLQTSVSTKYKHDKKRNEFQIKDWFLQDWYKLQDMFLFDHESYILTQGSPDFLTAKRQQYKNFSFDHKRFFHYKETPAMKEWGGLTHPPVKRLNLPLSRYAENFDELDYSQLDSAFFEPGFQEEIDKISQSELSFGNLVVPTVDNNAFEKKKMLILHARESILLSSLVFVCDRSGEELTNLLIKKHQEGISVKIMVDGFIGKVLKHRRCLRMMRKAGIEVVETKDFFRHKRNAIYHTKSLVVDFAEAVAGGHNLIDADNLSRSTDFRNRDIDLYVKGPMVTDISKQFIENWNYQAKLNEMIKPLHSYLRMITKKIENERTEGKRGREYYQEILNHHPSRMSGVCRFIKQAPYEDRHTIGKGYLKILDKVQHHLVIEDPVKSDTYVKSRRHLPLIEKFDRFEMYNQLHLKIQELAKNGKKIDLVTTNINMAGNENVAIMNDKIREQLEHRKRIGANWSLFKLHLSNLYYGKPHYKNLIKDWMPFPNVHIWKHISFMHSKVFYFDRIVASIGSYNFQHNATDHAYESTSICMDENLNRNLDRILVEDMVNSIPLVYSSLR